MGVGETNGHLDLHPLQILPKAAPQQRLVWRELQQQVLEKLQVPPAKRPKLALKVLASLFNLPGGGALQGEWKL